MKCILTIILSFMFLSVCYADNVVFETDWISSDEMTATVKKMDTNRIFPCFIQGRVDGIEIQYKGDYCPFLTGLNYFHSRWGMSDDWYDHYTKTYEEDGMEEYSHSTFEDLSGNKVHNATWVLMSR